MKIQPLLLLTLLAPLSGCEFISYEEYKIPQYDGDFTWSQITGHAQWSNRLDLAAVAFKNRLWIFGGYNPGQVKGDTYYEDVWSSPDGQEWQLVQANAPWKGRRGHTVTVFDDGNGEALYLIGGFSVDEETGYREYTNDVWRSTDGEQWELIQAKTSSASHWMPRMDHAVVVANHGGKNYLFLIGGSAMLENLNARYSMKYFNDVWRSSDGITWEDMHSDDYGVRSGHAAAVDPATGKIFVQGGLYGVIFNASNNENQPLPNWQWLWSTNDGTHWTAETPPASFDYAYLCRAEHKMAFYNNTLYTFPGRTNLPQHLHFAISMAFSTWKRTAADQWSVDSNGIDTDARYSYGFVEFNHRIWLLGGETNANGPSNDVWVAEIQ